MNQDSFLHCLRIQIVPGHFEDDRISRLVRYCRDYGFANVMLFINAEEYSFGHMSIEEAKPWVETIRKAKKILNENGISVSLNPWIEFGHVDRSRSLKGDQHFTTMTDYDGNRTSMVACPLCPEWRRYFAEFYTYLLKEIRPDTIWVEDDFRLHNHGNLHYGGCFCDLHMKKYNEKLHAHYTREEFTDLLFRKKSVPEVRKAWLDVSRETMTDTAEFIGKTVKAAGLGTKVGLMSSAPQSHAVEARDWHAVQDSLAQGGPLIHRPHLPCYIEDSGKQYYLRFNKIPFIVRAMLRDRTEVYPELENGAFSTFVKEPRFLRFQLESAIPLAIRGMTYDIFDFAGNGPIENFRYGEEVRSITPYLNGVMNLGFRFSGLQGVVIPVNEKTVYNRREIRSFGDFYPTEFNFCSYLASLGISCCPTTEKAFRGRIVALSDNAVNNFTDEELRTLFRDNRVLLEAGATKILVDRGLGGLIHAAGYEVLPAEQDRHSYEKISDENHPVNGIRGYRASAFAKAGDYLRIAYEGDKTETLSEVCDFDGRLAGPGIAACRSVYVIPYFFRDSFLIEQYNPLRTTLLYEWTKKQECPLALSGYSGVYCYLYDCGDHHVLILVNSTETDFSETRFTLKSLGFNDIRYVNKKTGALASSSYKEEDGSVVLPLEFPHLSTHTLVLKK